jgi:hypothetical protein
LDRFINAVNHGFKLAVCVDSLLVHCPCAHHEGIGGVEVELHTFLTIALEGGVMPCQLVSSDHVSKDCSVFIFRAKE